MECAYKIVGDIQIPEERREELNSNILKLLNAGGIRKVHKVKVAGKTVEVLKNPEVDDEGQVYFDYSIFEQMKRKISRYDTNTCRLYTEDRGYREFGAVMNMIMAMQESYSQSLCYLMYENEICRIWGYAVVIESLTGVKLSFPNRGRLWDMSLFFKKRKEYEKIDLLNILDAYPEGYSFKKLSQIDAAIESYLLHGDKEEYEVEKDMCIKNMSYNQRANYAYYLMGKYVEIEELACVEERLTNLLNSNLAVRESLCRGEESIFGKLAEISLYSLPAALVGAYASITKEKFWTVWFRLGIEEYSDIYENDEDIIREDKKRSEYPFYKIIFRDDEDDFIEFWNGNDMLFSTMLQDNFKIWRQEFDSIEDETVQGIRAEEYLANLILDMYGIWDACIVKESLIQDVIQHKDSIPYKKGLFLLNKLINADSDIFPELTSKQVLGWYSKRNRDKVKQKNIKDYVAMITNGLLRKEILGF